MQKYMVVLYGPTGVGKSDIADCLAHELIMNHGQRVAIVNLDMGQCYEPLTIGTAKPMWRLRSVPHYLFDIVRTPTSLTVVEYRRALLAILGHLWQEGIIPLLVGGSGFYVKSLFFPPCDVIKNGVGEVLVGDIPHNELWQKLHDVDPDRAKAIHRHDAYRLRRALEIWYTTGQKPSHFVPHYAPIAETLFICVQRERSQLYDRINRRVLEMFSAGWLQEVKQLLATPWEQFLLEKKIIGYDDIIRHLRHEITVEESISIIQQKTRAYAKRQMTFWRMLHKEIVHNHQKFPSMPVAVHEMNLTSMTNDLYIKQLSDSIWQKMSVKKQ